MLNLIKIEWEKHQMNRYFINFLYCIIGIYGFIILIARDSIHDPISAIGSFQEFTSIVTLIANITFMIFGSVLLSRLIIGEYRTKTMQVLFTYPINRKKLLMTKLILTYLLTSALLLFSIVIIQIVTYLIQPVYPLFVGTVTIEDLITALPAVIINALQMSAISLISLFFGMRKKSIPTTIISSVILAFLVNSTISNDGESFSLANVVFVPLSLAIIGISIAYLAFHNVNTKDVTQ